MLAGRIRPLKSGELINIAYALIIMISVFSSLINAVNAQVMDLFLLIMTSIAYIVLGIYGFTYAKTRQQEILYFLIQIFLASLLVFLEKGTGYQALIFLPLVGQAVVAFSLPWNLLVNFCILLGFSIAGYFSAADPAWLERNLFLFIAGQVFVIVFTQMAVDEEKTRIKVEELAKNLNSANRQLKDYARQVEQLATEKERNRLAREIHDGLGHQMTTINMQLEAALAVLDKTPEKAREILGISQELARHSMHEIRKSVKHLQEGLNSREVLSEQVSFIMRNAEVTGLECTLEVNGEEVQVTPEISLTILRVLQEAISNILKHSRARKLSVVLDYSNRTQIFLVIQDDGIGLQTNKKGFGMKSMQERVSSISGKLSVETRQGRGTTIALEIPR